MGPKELNNNMMLHTRLVNPTCLQSFMVWYCAVCELRCLDSRRRWENRHFLFNPIPMDVVSVF